MTGHDEPGPAERAGQYAEAVTTGWAAGPAHRAGGGPAPGPAAGPPPGADLVLNLGAAHLLEKPFRAPALIEVIDRVKEHGGNVRHKVEQVLVHAKLTDKELVVARHLLQGLSYGEIAELESNSPKTIRQHVSTIYAKCGVASRAQFFRLAYLR